MSDFFLALYEWVSIWLLPVFVRNVAALSGLLAVVRTQGFECWWLKMSNRNMHTRAHARAHTHHSSEEMKKTKTHLPLYWCVCWFAHLFFFLLPFSLEKVCIKKKCQCLLNNLKISLSKSKQRWGAKFYSSMWRCDPDVSERNFDR